MKFDIIEEGLYGTFYEKHLNLSGSQGGGGGPAQGEGGEGGAEGEEPGGVYWLHSQPFSSQSWVLQYLLEKLHIGVLKSLVL